MSWSVSAVGKAPAVRKKIADDVAKMSPCSEPEETVKQNLVASIGAALATFPPNTAVRVEASGSQYAPDSKAPTELLNTVSLKIEPIGGFIE